MMKNNAKKSVSTYLKFLSACFAFILFCALTIVVRTTDSEIRTKISNFPIISNLIKEYDKVSVRAKATSLNHFIPSFNNLAKFIIKAKEADKEYDLSTYIEYYEKVAEYFPELADAYGMLGFCYYYSGDSTKATEYYKKAIELNSNYFWYYYNLGLILFKNNSYKQAAVFFSSALKAKPNDTIKSLYSSKIYQQIKSSGLYTYDEVEGLKKSYKKCSVLLYLSNYFIRNQKGVLDDNIKYLLEEVDKIEVQNF